MTAPDKLTVEQCDRDAAADIWLDQHGDPGTALRMRLGHLEDNWMVQVLARYRQQAEAGAEGLVAALEQYQDQFCEGLCDGGPHFEFDCSGCPAGKVLTAYRSARP